MNFVNQQFPLEILLIEFIVHYQCCNLKLTNSCYFSSLILIPCNSLMLIYIVGGFDADLSTIISALPSKRQTLLFTATNSPSITSVIKSCNNNPHIWTSPDLSESSTVENLEQKYLLTPPEAKDSYLVQLLFPKDI